ncbi:unnamed protein product [Protopolystoma xenopodis]|uniref:Uncharacterized protein n=1 Tax=Protopolystoma xenopodis TaxID=117903 RepID=A0A448XDI9_9PLAT|nr:unnamed protein product [Protopolystoma xenopodis]
MSSSLGSGFMHTGTIGVDSIGGLMVDCVGPPTGNAASGFLSSRLFGMPASSLNNLSGQLSLNGGLGGLGNLPDLPHYSSLLFTPRTVKGSGVSLNFGSHIKCAEPAFGLPVHLLCASISRGPSSTEAFNRKVFQCSGLQPSITVTSAPSYGPLIVGDGQVVGNEVDEEENDIERYNESAICPTKEIKTTATASLIRAADSLKGTPRLADHRSEEFAWPSSLLEQKAGGADSLACMLMLYHLDRNE